MVHKVTPIEVESNGITWTNKHPMVNDLNYPIFYKNFYNDIGTCVRIEKNWPYRCVAYNSARDHWFSIVKYKLTFNGAMKFKNYYLNTYLMKEIRR